MADGAVYSAYDTNADGYLDKAEFEQYLIKRRIKSVYRPLWQFEKVDTDRSGHISSRELIHTLQKEITLRRQHKQR